MFDVYEASNVCHGHHGFGIGYCPLLEPKRNDRGGILHGRKQISIYIPNRYDSFRATSSILLDKQAHPSLASFASRLRVLSRL
jgi:hypothetical protein